MPVQKLDVEPQHLSSSEGSTVDIRPPEDGVDSVELEPEESLDPEDCFMEGEKDGRTGVLNKDGKSGAGGRGSWGATQRHRLLVPSSSAKLTVAAERRRRLMLNETEEEWTETQEAAAFVMQPDRWSDTLFFWYIY